MSRLFWGFFFIFVNFNLNLNAHTLNILPPFVGYLLLLQGMRDLETESELFRGPRPFAVGMAIYTGILWLGDLLGAVSSAGWMGTLLGLAATVVSLYVAWAIIQGVQDMESRRNTDLGASGMHRAWIVLAVAQAVSYGMLFLLPALALVGVLAALVGVIMLLAAFWRGKKLYEPLPPLEGPAE